MISGDFRQNRRAFGACLMAAFVSGCAAGAGDAPLETGEAAPAKPALPPEPDWRDHFDDLSRGAILINLNRKFLAYWEPNDFGFHVFPIAVPLTEELRRTGDTKIVRRKENPEWRPTPDMLRRNPNLPEFIGPGPENPLGDRALYLGWRYYAIHGTNDPRSIGAQATSGCIRLTQNDIRWLYDQAMIGTPVRILDDFEVHPSRRRARSASAYSAAVE